MNKKLIRLTENDLHRIVKESVKRVVRESRDDYHYDGKGIWPALKMVLDDILERNPSPNSYINQWATRVSQEADDIMNHFDDYEAEDDYEADYEADYKRYSDPYKKMGRMDTAI